MLSKICKGCDKEYKPRHDKDHRCRSCYSSMGSASKRKGSNNERRLAKYIQSQFNKYGLNYSVYRTPRSGGIAQIEQADIMFKVPIDSVFNNIHIEAKDQHNWDIEGWYKKVVKQENDSGKYRTPVIIVRKPNSQDEFAIIKMEYFIKLLIKLDKSNE